MTPPLALLLLAAPLLPAPPAGEDLAQRYPATLDHVEDNPPAHGWISTPQDVWRLSGWSLDFGERLSLRARAATLVVGHHEGNALWAVVLPDRPFEIDSSLGGGGESALHVWLRFHPSRIGELFPERTVRGQGPREARFEAYRIYAHKVSSLWASTYEPSEEGQPARSWFTGFRPLVPPRDDLVVDMDTEQGPRRVYSVDLASGGVRLRGAFLTWGLARPNEIRRIDALGAWERACAVGRGMLDAGREAEVESWEVHAKEARRSFLRATNDHELACAVYLLLRPFGDPWLTLRYGQDWLPAMRWDRRPLNASWGGVKDILTDVAGKKGVWTGRTPHGVGYVVSPWVDEPEDVEAFDAALEELSDNWGLIVDLRFGFAGEREHLQALAGRFVEEPTTYARLVVPEEGGGEEVRELVVEPRGPWPWRGHVFALIGPNTMLEGEGLALALAAAPKGATMGGPTAGVGLTAGWETLPGGVDLFRRKGRTHDCEDRPLPEAGLGPDVPIEVEPTAFGPKKDPVLYRALEEIYQVPHPERLRAKDQEPFSRPSDPGKGE